MKALLLVILCISCAPKPPIVYFKEPKSKIHAKTGPHGRHLSSHYIPSNEDISHLIVMEYDKMYGKKLHETKRGKNYEGLLWVLTYLLLVLIGNLNALL